MSSPKIQDEKKFLLVPLFVFFFIFWVSVPYIVKCSKDSSGAVSKEGSINRFSILGHVRNDLNEKIPKKVVWVVPAPADEPEFVEGVVAEAPIPLGGGICLVGVSIDTVHDGRDVRAVLVSADRPLVVGQKVKVKIRLISETHRPANDLLVIQDDNQK